MYEISKRQSNPRICIYIIEYNIERYMDFMVLRYTGKYNIREVCTNDNFFCSFCVWVIVVRDSYFVCFTLDITDWVSPCSSYIFSFNLCFQFIFRFIHFFLRTIYYFVFHFIFFRVSFLGNKLLMISICVSNEHTTEYKVIVSEKVWVSSTAFHNSKCAQNLLCHLIRSELAYVIGWDGVSYIFHIFYHLFPPKCYTLVVWVSMRSTFICMSFANFKMIFFFIFFPFVAFHSEILQIYFLIHLFSIYCSCLP